MEMLSATRLEGLHSKIFLPLEHYDYQLVDAFCLCPVCADWRWKQMRFQRLVERTAGHGIACRCCACDDKMSARSPHLAALNRRDLYCEASWHAAQIAEEESAFTPAISALGSGMGLRFMDWVQGQFKVHREGWWVITAPYRAMADWIEDFTNAAAASGIGVAGVARVTFRS
jgi:hypothetical protein